MTVMTVREQLGSTAPRVGARRFVLVLLVVGLILCGLAGSVLGWRLHAMTTPSMGRTAPVGSVVITSPVSVDDVHAGEIIAFHPPGRPDTTYVHRVFAIDRVFGRTVLRTKGDINSSVDGWALTGTDLVGRERAVVPDLGFAMQLLPALLLGGLVIMLGTSRWRRDRRGPARTGLFALLGSLLLWHYRPLSRVELVTQTIEHGHGRATLVPTGVLPLRVQAAGGTWTDLTPGQLGTVARQHLPQSGHFVVDTAIHLTGWWWLLVLAWLVPLAASLRYRRVPAPVRRRPTRTPRCAPGCGTG